MMTASPESITVASAPCNRWTAASANLNGSATDQLGMSAHVERVPNLSAKPHSRYCSVRSW
jgi:hypothetical protein